MELCVFFLLLAVSGCGRQGRIGEETEGHTDEHEQSELYDYADELPADYEGTLSMWGWDDRYVQAVTDVDTAIAEFKAAMESAGIRDVEAELQTQIEAYLADK